MVFLYIYRNTINILYLYFVYLKKWLCAHIVFIVALNAVTFEHYQLALFSLDLGPEIASRTVSLKRQNECM